MPTIEELAQEVAGLRQRVEAAESILQLHELKARYGELVDRRFSAGQVVDDVTLRRLAKEASELFTVDGVWDGGPGLGRRTGSAPIADRLARADADLLEAPVRETPHHGGGSRAWGRWDLLSPCLRQDGTSWWMCGYEDDEYARVQGVWLHHSMVLTTVFLTRAEPGWGRILA